MKTINTHSLVGKTVTSIDADGTSFTTSDGKQYIMRHEQSCCEYVRHSHTIGRPKDLIGAPLIFANDDHAEPADHPNMAKPSCDSHTWTVFQFHTATARLEVWWLGESNGYYSEDVNLFES